jgi:anti-sigma factor (TIGR02949 family)
MNQNGADAEPISYNQCQEAVKRLTEFLDHELRPEEEAQVRRHLGECGGCFTRFHFEETLLQTIRERAEAIRAPGTLREKILALVGRASKDAPDESGEPGA